MNGDRPKIEIFAPFGAAYEWMKIVLFKPFDFGKWLTIAFAAFLSGAWGNGLNFNYRSWKGDTWDFQSVTHNSFSTTNGSAPAWLIPLIIAVFVVVFALVLLFMWLSSRGRFIFVDCVVKNRGAIVAPWREFRREGNSFFLFSLLLMFITLISIVALGLVIALPLGLFSGETRSNGIGAIAVFALIFAGLIAIGLAIFLSVVTNFMIPVMYTRRCRAREAFRDVAKLVLNRPGPFILFVLFGFVLALALIICGTLLACMTCCIGGLPYVSTVLLLPAIVWLLAFKLLFFQQFGPQYDAWAGVAIPESPGPSEPMPPVQPPVA
ncbi:MAG: hypothetical protein QOD12_2745 [Verrucomicrobiota bacterium]|jgi:hypothetical protein